MLFNTMYTIVFILWTKLFELHPYNLSGASFLGIGLCNIIVQAVCSF